MSASPPRATPTAGRDASACRRARLLFLYNASSATLWWCCLGRLFILLPLVGRRFLPGGIAEFFQVIALTHLVGHLLRYGLGYRPGPRQSPRYFWSLVYAVKACYICYLVIFPHAQIAKHVTYSVLVFSWALQLLVAHTFYTLRSLGVSYAWLTRVYTYLPMITFPASTVAEMILIFLSLAYSDDDSWTELINKTVLVAYVPAFYFAWPYAKKQSVATYKGIVVTPQTGNSRES